MKKVGVEMKIIGIIYYSMIFLLSPMLAATETNATVRLLNFVEVQAPEITLGEIPAVDSDDQQLKMKLINIVIDQAPRIDTTRLISSYIWAFITSKT